MLIAHATDLTGDDTSAFLHASALAAASSSRLVTVHGNAPDADASRLPDASHLAARWGRPIDHERRCHECCEDVADTVIDALRALRPELVVLGTHGRHGLAALVHGSVSETVARNLEVPVLIVPNRGRGFVDPATGAIDLHRIVIPAGTVADAQRGLDAARRLLALGGKQEGTLEIVHIGAADPKLDRLGVPVTRIEGPLEAAIVEVARMNHACVIVMPTSGHDGFGDVLLGSHTERVIREASCPVLSVPM
jgi:nucleotide-binding universal stress UspA family protein